ncbi:hypothetical protein HYW36_02395 [Candidatus Saccharibacteria bacterium]|nr:hypothetical protein [Candidatus Saccharibacteria bacterium]
MERSDQTETGQPEPQKPAWSVLAGEFDPSDPTLNSILVARMVDYFWFNPIHSENRRRMHATELVLRAYEICGLDRFAVKEKIENTIADLMDYSKQLELSRQTPELIGMEGQERDEGERTETTLSPVMHALRALIKLSNSVNSITIQDRIRQEADKEKWAVDGDTRRLAEAVIRSLYLEEIRPRPVE